VNSKSGDVHANAFLEMNLYIWRNGENICYARMQNVYIFKTLARLLSAALMMIISGDTSDYLLFESKIEPLGKKKEQSNGFTSSHLKY
jgi:hypothetical protein